MNLNYKPKYPVQTLEKALNVLLFLKNSNSRFGLSIAEISEGTGMPKSGVHRILDTFLEYEFVEKKLSKKRRDKKTIYKAIYKRGRERE